MIKDKEKLVENITELSHLLDNAGVETVSMQSRNLDMKEAIFLQSRIVRGTEQLVKQDEFNPEKSSIKHNTAG